MNRWLKKLLLMEILKKSWPTMRTKQMMLLEILLIFKMAINRLKKTNKIWMTKSRSRLEILRRSKKRLSQLCLKSLLPSQIFFLASCLHLAPIFKGKWLFNLTQIGLTLNYLPKIKILSMKIKILNRIHKKAQSILLRKI